jgi:protein-S-isoprenylcysteine O-methyltransferase Ste14
MSRERMDGRRAPIFAIVPPPVAYTATFLVGWGVSRFVGWAPAWIEAPPVRALGLAIAIAGLALGAFAGRLFLSRRTTFIPAGQPVRLVDGGVYAWTRNPMYVGLTLIYAGTALALGQVFTLALVVLPWAVVNWIVIPFEEARLRATFGQDYVDYCRRVRRWL